MAKPTVYREDLAEEILTQLALGKSLASIYKDRRMPTYRSVIPWLVRDFRGLAERYWAARRAQCIHLSEQIITIADEAIGADMAGANVAKLRCDARKWTLARMDSGRWGEQIAHQHQVSGRAEINIYLPQKGGERRLIEGVATKVVETAEAD
jgi:hypothetical protein